MPNAVPDPVNVENTLNKDIICLCSRCSHIYVGTVDKPGQSD